MEKERESGSSDWSGEDARLMQLSSAGDLEAFSAIVSRYQGRLLNYFARMCASIEDAEDLVQETFVRLFNYRSRYRPIAGFPSFLFTLARHARLDMLRRSARNPASSAAEIGDDADLPSGDRTPDDCIDVKSAVDGLSEKLRETVALTVYAGLSYPEAAEVLGVPAGTVKSRMFAAFEKLREVLLKGGFNA